MESYAKLPNPNDTRKGYWYGTGKYQSNFEEFVKLGNSPYSYINGLNKILNKMYNDGLSSLHHPGKFSISDDWSKASYAVKMDEEYMKLFHAEHSEIEKPIEEFIRCILTDDKLAFALIEYILDMTLEFEISV